MILAANYMDIKSLLDLCCAKVASLIKGKTTEEIRKTFNIKNDFTPGKMRRASGSGVAVYLMRDCPLQRRKLKYARKIGGAKKHKPYAARCVYTHGGDLVKPAVLLLVGDCKVVSKKTRKLEV